MLDELVRSFSVSVRNIALALSLVINVLNSVSANADELGDRLLNVATQDCSAAPGMLGLPVQVEACQTRRIMALNAFGQRFILQGTHHGRPFEKEFDAGIKKAIFNEQRW